VPGCIQHLRRVLKHIANDSIVSLTRGGAAWGVSVKFDAQLRKVEC